MGSPSCHVIDILPLGVCYMQNDYPIIFYALFFKLMEINEITAVSFSGYGIIFTWEVSEGWRASSAQSSSEYSQGILDQGMRDQDT